MRTLDPSLRQIGEGLQMAGEGTVQTPMPWHFLELLCQLDEKEKAIGNEADDRTREHGGWESAARVRPENAS